MRTWALDLTRRREHWLLVGLCGLAFALRVPGLTFQSLWRDEVDSIRFASQPLAELLRAFSSPGQNGPLYFVLLRPWLLTAGQSEFALRFLSVLFGVLTVPLIYRVAGRLGMHRPVIGLVAGLLAATSPYLVWYSQEGKMYTMVLCAVLASIERFLAATHEGGWRRWLGYVLATSACFYIHLVAVLVVPAEAVMFVVLGGWARPGARKAFVISICGLALPYAPLLIWQLPMIAQSAQTGYRFVPLPAVLATILSNYSLGVTGHEAWWALAIVVGGLLAGVPLTRRSWKETGAVASWLFVPTLLFYLVTLRRPMFTARYLIFVLPALLLVMAAGAVKAARRSKPLGAALLTGLLFVQGWGLWLQARTPLKSDFRGATAYLAPRLAAGDVILFEIPYGRYSLGYYFGRSRPQLRAPGARGGYRIYLPWVAGGAGPYRWEEGLYTNAGMTPEEVGWRMSEIVGGGRTVWLVASESALWDERGLVQGWLLAHGRLTNAEDLTGVSVYRFELAP